MYRPQKPRTLDKPVTIIIRPAIENAGGPIELTCCTNLRAGANAVSCRDRGGRDVVRALRNGIRKLGLGVVVKTSGCLGSCNAGPNIRIAPNSSWMSGARVADLPLMLDALERIVAEHRTMVADGELD